MSIKDMIFIVFLIAFGVTFHDWAGAQLGAGGVSGLFSLQGGWFGFAIMLVAFLVYRHVDMEATTKLSVAKDIGEGSLLTMGMAFLTIGLNAIKTDFEGGITISGIGVACILFFIVIESMKKEKQHS